MRQVALVMIAGLVLGCAPHQEEREVPTEPVATVAEATVAYDTLVAECQALGPHMANLIFARIPQAEAHVDAISVRVVDACIERGEVDTTRCVLAKTELEQVRSCAPEWAMPIVGVPTCDAYFHDVLCLVDQLAPNQEEVVDAMYQSIGAWYEVGLNEEAAPSLSSSCEMALDAMVGFEQAEECFAGRALRPTP